MASSSFGSSNSQSTSTPEAIQTPQSQWGLQLSQLLGALTQNQYAWARNQYDAGMAVTEQSINKYMQLADQGAGLAQNLLGRYENVFEPLMNQFIEQAGTYNSVARQRFNMGQAESTAGQADQAAMDSAQKQLQGFGVNPNSGRYQDLIQTSRLQDAATRAGAGTQASVNTANTGRQMLQQAAQFGQNVPGMTVNALQSAYTGIGGAENAILGQLNTGANLMNTVPNFANAAANANRLPPVGQVAQSTSGSQQGSQSSDPPKAPQQPKEQPQQQPKQQPMQGQGNGNGSGANHDSGGYSGSNRVGQRGGTIGNPYKSQDDQNQQDQFGAGSTPFIPDVFNGDGTSPGLNGGNGGYSNLAGFVDTNPSGSQPGNSMPGSGPAFGQDPFNGSGAQPGFFGQQGIGSDTSGPTDPFGNQSFNPGGSFGQSSGGNYDPNGNFQGLGADQTFGSGVGNSSGNPIEDQSPQWDPSVLGGNYTPSGDFQGLGADQTFGSGVGNSSGNPIEDQSPGGDYTPPSSGGDYAPPSGGDYIPQASGGGDYTGGYAKGGVIRNRTTGGFVPPSASPSQGRRTDDIPARLNAKEFVIPRDVSEHYGTKYFHDLIAKSRKARTGMAGPPARGKMKPALRMRPTFTSSYMGNR